MFELKLKTFDGTQIAFNHLRRKERDEVIIICHGFCSAKDNRPFLDMSRDFFSHMDVINMDQRGHGNSSGFFSFSSQEHGDIRAVIEFARTIYTRVHLMGFSLGAASSAIEVAESGNVASLILVSPPADFVKIENHFLDRNILSYGLKRFTFHYFKLRPGNPLQRKIKPAEAVERINNIPLLVIHGEKDRIIFPWHGSEVYAHANEPKKLVIFEKGEHAEAIYEEYPERFISLCLEWIGASSTKYDVQSMK
ncbi:MAG: hypothetical protein A2231_00105 [Candidatus Firestonebacteria bacterium RIFOXYA2_FULL_40_8]|nr:MAG: hypothetical protein A2231_00105 [Candidatus Firestonebacteria bacterium RIFOXYA2_FULL_40_8]